MLPREIDGRNGGGDSTGAFDNNNCTDKLFEDRPNRGQNPTSESANLPEEISWELAPIENGGESIQS